MVGGTNYYIESLLWDILVSPTTTTTDEQSSSLSPSKEGEGDEVAAAFNADKASTEVQNDAIMSGNSENVCSLHFIYLVFFTKNKKRK